MAALNHSMGTDVGYMLREESSGKLVSAIGKVNGTKDQPLIMPNGGNLHYDNIMAEVCHSHSW